MAAQDALPGLADVGNASAADGASADPFHAAVPKWLADRLEDVNPLRRSAHARLEPCGRCRAPVLKAADMTLDLMADSVVDPAVITQAEELAAILAGRYTAELEPMRHGGGPLVYRRDRWLIPKPAGARGRVTVPAHTCWDPLGVPFPLEMIYPQVFAQHTTEPGADDEPPF